MKLDQIDSAQLLAYRVADRTGSVLADFPPDYSRYTHITDSITWVWHEPNYVHVIGPAWEFSYQVEGDPPQPASTMVDEQFAQIVPASMIVFLRCVNDATEGALVRRWRESGYHITSDMIEERAIHERSDKHGDRN